MTTVYIDPQNDNQVMAIYDGCKPGNPQVWIDQGFVEVTIEDTSPLHSDVRRYKRDCCVDVDNEVITSRVNPVQPDQDSVSPRAARLNALDVRLVDDTITDAEVRELLRLSRGL